jgi:short-subunit dehydrogenase
LVDEVLAEAGRIDVLVNNAGIGLLGGVEESSTAQAQALFDVNVFGVLRMTKAVLPTMRRQRKGRIINMSSIMGLIPAPYNALYASTKHAIEGYSESLDHELRTFGIRVALVEPGFTRTSVEENLAKPDCLLATYDPARVLAWKRTCGTVWNRATLPRWWQRRLCRRPRLRCREDDTPLEGWRAR